MVNIRNTARVTLTAAGIEFEPRKPVDVPATVARALLTNPNFERVKPPRSANSTQPTTAETED